MKSIIKKIIPNRLKDQMLLIWNYYSDMKLFSKYSFKYTRKKTKRHLQADIIFFYHKIEKGLSLPNPRVGFGKEAVNYLLEALENYVDKYNWDNESLIALKTLYDYYYFNKDNNNENTLLFSRIEMLRKKVPADKKTNKGGVIKLKKSDIDKSNINFEDFAYSRYSIRNFGKGDVSIKLIEKAVYIAQKTPSVCNRQTSRVYVYSDQDMKKRVLKLQNGNSGFGEDASKILIITADIRDFRGITERNQCFIDGGMFGMSLIYALHSLGVGTCALNLCSTNKKAQKIKKIAGIGESEVLIMMIAVGNIPEELYVAASPRREIDEVIKIY